MQQPLNSNRGKTEIKELITIVIAFWFAKSIKTT